MPFSARSCATDTPLRRATLASDSPERTRTRFETSVVVEEPYRAIDGFGTSRAPAMVSAVGMRTSTPAGIRPRRSVDSVGLIDRSDLTESPVISASDCRLRASVSRSSLQPSRSLADNAANAGSNTATDPTGMRTSETPSGGVTPRRKCGFSSMTISSGTPAAFAMAPSAVPAGTVTESYANSGNVSTRSP